jgi:DNA-binding SARP family transcriptional activator/pimeloyl-ACP methyl ester carboxylesterase
VRISLLGPLMVDGEPGEAVLRAAKERSLLAALALSPGQVVGFDSLVDALWGDAPPATARKTLQTYMSNMRRALGPEAVETAASGYVLRADPEDVDVGRFRALVRRGEEALRSGSVPQACEDLGAAVGLWRGAPFPGVGAGTGLAAAAVRLKEEYLSALEARLAAELAAGHHAEMVGELQALVREHPFRERLWGHLMVALYRSGRQADALAVYQQARVRLRDELGLEPGGELRRLERAVLDQDPSLDGPDPGRGPAHPAGPGPHVRPSPVRYAVTRDGVHVAYQVVGDGPIDLLAVPGFVSHLDMWWDAPTDRLVRRLASFSRLILFDKRGMGLSDRPAHIDVEHWVADALAVLDAAGSERAVILGISAGSPTASLLAASHPERARALIIYGGYARYLAGDDYPLGARADTLDARIRHIEAHWGTGVGIGALAASRADDPAVREYWARCQTISASPSAAGAFLRALAAIDVRHALPTITAPTLILHPTGDQSIPVEAARDSRDLIPGARLVELDSDTHLIWLSEVIDVITREIEAFIGGSAGPVDAERALATVLAVADPQPAPGRDAAVAATVERLGGCRLPSPAPGRARATFDGPARAIRCALALVAELGPGDGAVAAAVHSGECERRAQGLRGVAVDLADQLAAGARPGEVLVTQTVRDLTVGSAIRLEPRGRRSFDNIPGHWDILAVASVDPSRA